ncbi:hypothetical protein [Pedobacter montanisoli]|uniref:Uncharacterized protein n=1 Tax=Pedobacter montanisoli TaxID=2923277 RepID=A0ABS9ZWX5_9SPHI|nr:hypothetical protein [Pedobacter montanisoli]MCJ0742817.1 hypothetical protein [Pedobacter montanisoli]
MTKRIDYYYLPKKFRKKHDFCEFVINDIERLVIDETFVELKTQIINLPENLKIENDTQDHIFDILQANGLRVEHNQIIRTHLLLSLIMETCYFLQESLLCSLKMRMTVCFTLLRKPFLEISILLMRILNESDFIERFSNEDGFDPIKTTPNQKKGLIEKTNNFLNNKFQPDDLFDYIFSKEFGDSLFNLTNNAIHLYTDRNPIVATEKQNLNFIFSTWEDIEAQWEYIYENLPMLISFIADVIEVLVFKSTSVDEKIFIGRLKKRDKMRKKYNVS